ncbi:polysaccharide lyase family 7 protein [Streptomyces sp. MK37H]|uniref:polysaccharide lyase family 7 protein n=1 Tax=Streptomyces sp. MK37H TaxID=2699117 RepID=UPI001B362A17|nr:polysaccharide lyase family 7 protein [Streptomyces sp. MK37H]MBP8538157.1 polysaccharide lyase family 7 protein [Streptomyces sp. MK37H]
MKEDPSARRTPHRALVFVAVSALAVGVLASVQSASAAPADAAACPAPASAIGLSTGWKLQLPTPNSSGSPLEVKQPQLSTYDKAPWFTTASSCDAILMRAAVNGATTSNTGYPRSELREMTADGSATTGWSSTTGTHTMVVDEAITHLPSGKPHVMAGQIHDATSDVTSFRLEGTNLYITSYNTTHYKLVTSGYKLGDRFQGKFVAHDGKVDVYYNGTLQATVNAKFGSGYFKAGDYTQANCGNATPCDDSNYGEVALYGVTVKHT